MKEATKRRSPKHEATQPDAAFFVHGTGDSTDLHKHGCPTADMRNRRLIIIQQGKSKERFCSVEAHGRRGQEDGGKS